MSETAVPRSLSAASRFAVRFIETYRTDVSHRVRTACRFEPSCSTYGLHAYQRYGFWRATAKTLRRLSRCRASHEERFDPP